MALDPKTGIGIVNGYSITYSSWLEGADLSGADLRGAEFRGCVLRNANLRGADLRGARLGNANLDGADLTGANLTGAFLFNTRLVGADLTGADFVNADMMHANLLNAMLYETDFEGSSLTAVILPNGTYYSSKLDGHMNARRDPLERVDSRLVAFLEKINFPFGAEGLASAPEELILSRIAEVEALALRLSGMPKQATPGDTVARVLDRKPELTGPIMDEVVSMLDALGEE